MSSLKKARREDFKNKFNEAMERMLSAGASEAPEAVVAKALLVASGQRPAPWAAEVAAAGDGGAGESKSEMQAESTETKGGSHSPTEAAVTIERLRTEGVGILSQDALHGSFVLAGAPLDIDAAAALAFWGELQRMAEGSDDVLEVVQATLAGLSDLQVPAEALARGVAVQLLNPMLADPMHTDALNALCQCLGKLAPEGLQALCALLSELAAEPFAALVGAVQQHVTLAWLMKAEDEDEHAPPAPLHGREPYEKVAAGVRLLAVLYVANGGRGLPPLTPGGVGDTLAHSADPGAKVPWKMYYNEAISNEVLDERNALVLQYREWLADAVRLRHRRSEGDGGVCLSDLASMLSYPFVLDPAVKAAVLNLNAMQQMRAQIDQSVHNAIIAGSVIEPYLVVRVHRASIVQDTLNQFVYLPDDAFKKPLRVEFIGEDGVDEGGVRKEFFQVIIRNLLNPDYAMFLTDEDANTLFFNPDTMIESPEYELIGILLGVAIYNGVILDLPFPLVVYKMLLGVEPTFDDLRSAKPAVASSLQQFLEMAPREVAAMEQAWALTYDTYLFGERNVKTVPLKPGGEDLTVTYEQRAEYVQAYAHWWLQDGVKESFGAFRSGFLKVCGGKVLNMLRPEELELLACGNPVLDFDALEASSVYADGFTKDSPAIINLWKVVHSLDDDGKRRFLKFVSGSDRAPVNGLGSLRMVVSPNGDDSERLPTSHTCFTHLLLPQYNTLEKLRDRLLLAIENTEGFGLR